MDRKNISKELQERQLPLTPHLFVDSLNKLGANTLSKVSIPSCLCLHNRISRGLDMNLKIFSAALAAIYLVTIPANSKDVTPFEDIMALMEGADITYERIGKYTRPFKLK